MKRKDSELKKMLSAAFDFISDKDDYGDRIFNPRRALITAVFLSILIASIIF